MIKHTFHTKREAVLFAKKYGIDQNEIRPVVHVGHTGVHTIYHVYK